MAPRVDFWIDGGWVDVTDHVLNEQRVDLNRNAGWQAIDVSFSSGTCEFVLKNLPAPVTGVGPWSLFHPLAEYFGRVGEGTEVRVYISELQRFHGQISALEFDGDPTGNAGWVEVEVLGALGPYDGEQKAIGSPATRAIMSPENSATRLAYWPLEEETGADGGRSPMGSPPLLIVGDVEFGASTTSPATERLVRFGADGQIQATVPTYTSTGQIKVCSTWEIPEGEVPDTTRLLRCYLTGGTVGWVDLRYGTGGVLAVDVFVNGLIHTVAVNVIMGDRIYGRDCFLSLEMAQDGADIDVLVLAVSDITDGATGGGTVTGQTLGRIHRIIVAQTPCDGVGFGQLLAGNSTTAFGNYISTVPTGGLGTRGYAGESGPARILRLLGEHDMWAGIRQVASNVDGCGPQAFGGLVDCLNAAANADGGMLFEQRDLLAGQYVDRPSLYNQTPKVTLDYDASTLASQLRPARNPAVVRNWVTVSRDGGGTGTYTIPDGDPYHRSTEPAPAGIGTKPGQLSLNLDIDARARSFAGWYAHLGSHTDPSYATLSVRLHSPTYASDVDLRLAVLDVDIGDVIRVTNPPSWCPPGFIDLLVHGIAESADTKTHEITFSVVPAEPWGVWPVNSAGSHIVVDIDSDDTELKLETTSGPGWDTTSEPYHIHIGGEAIRVDDMVTDTPAFIATGTAASANNASVSPGLPAGMTPDVGQLMLLFAAIRNSGTGTVNQPAGWTHIRTSGNMSVYARYRVTGDTAPTVTFTGGVAGADTQAIIAGFSGLSMEYASGTKAAPDGSSQLNSSAQDVAYPALTIPSDRTGAAIIFVWKADDNSGAGTPSGFTAMFNQSTTTGDDQSIVGRYDLTATSAAAGTVTMTGGAAAISRAMVFALRPLQTATVTRGVNGVSLSHLALDTISAWRPGVTAA